MPAASSLARAESRKRVNWLNSSDLRERGLNVLTGYFNAETAAEIEARIREAVGVAGGMPQSAEAAQAD